MFEINTLETVKLQNFIQNEKTLNLGPKLHGLDNFKLELEKAIIIFEISTFKFVKMQSFMLKKKS